MRAIDADALQLAIVEEGQANKRKKYIIGDIWELTGAEIREVINSQPTIQPEPHWHPVSEQPQEEDDYLLLTHEKFKHGTFKRIIIGAWNSATKEWLEEYGDMYRAVNHPVAWISKDELLLLKGYEVTT